MRRFLRLRVLALAAGVLLVTASATAYVAGIRPARRFRDQAHRAGLNGPTVAVVLEAERALGAPRPAGVRLETAAGEVRDAAAIAGRTVVATGGGAILGGGGTAPRLVTTLDGLGDVDLRAAAPFAGGVALGGADGRLTLVGPAGVRVVRVGAGGPAPVADLVRAGDLLYVAWLGRGAVALGPGGRALALDAGAGGTRRPDLASVTALAVGPGRYALGTLAGEVHVGDGRALTRVCASVPGGRVMALGYDGDALLVGTPLGVALADGRGGCPLIVPDLFVTALAVERPLLYVATFDDGVHVIDRGGGGVRRTAHLLAGTRIDRLRALGGEHEGVLAAIGPRGAYALAAGAARPLGLPRPPAGAGRLAGPHVTALVRAPGGRLYAGTFEHGIDVLGPGGEVALRLPRARDATTRQINGFALLADTGEVAAATTRGVVVLGPAGERRVTSKDGLAGDEVGGLWAGPGGTLLAATNRGLTALGPGGARTVGAFHGLGNNHTYAVAVSGTTTFAGTLGGLTLLRDLKVLKNLAAGRGPLRASWVSALAPAREPGAVWVGLYGGGLARVTEDGAVESVAPDEPGFHVNPGALAVDPVSGVVVAGTLERGAVVVDPRTRAVRRLDVPLPSANVTAVLLEADAIHLGTDRGLVRVTRAAAGLLLARDARGEGEARRALPVEGGRAEPPPERSTP
ncbi:MAG TPA: hypothetical protein VGQ83_33080 [Polyangia bacterium]